MSGILSLGYYDDRNWGVVNDVVAGAAEEGAANGVQASRSHHNGMSTMLLGIENDSFTSIFRMLTNNFVFYL